MSSKRRGTSPALPRWHGITIIERAATCPRGAVTTIKVAIKTTFFRGRAIKQNKAVSTLDPVSEPTKTTSVKILDEMGNKAKEKLPNFKAAKCMYTINKLVVYLA